MTYYFLAIVIGHLLMIGASAARQPMKCCPLNQTYDVIEKVCSAAVIEPTVFKFDPATTEVLSPHCGDDRVLVEYDSGSYNITLRNTTLWMPSHFKPDTLVSLPGSAFCVDNVMDVEADGPRWVVKACQPRNVCEVIPCVRKCCQDGETLRSVNNELTCKMNQQGLPLRFHNISDGVALRVDVPTFGVLHYQRCALFQASRYQYVDFHPKFDAETGHLHQFFLTEEYGHDEYCVDFVKSDDRTFQKLQSFVCHDNVEFRSEQKVFIACVTVSALLVGLTLLVYVLIPSVSNRNLSLPGLSQSEFISCQIHTMSDRAHIRFVGCLFVSYLFELWRSLSVDMHYVVCIVIGE
jgi:G protein-coupled receptor Mth (Methuselah protein)